MAWMLGMMLAGLAGVIALPIFNTLSSDLFNQVLFVAAAAAVLGASDRCLLRSSAACCSA